MIIQQEQTDLPTPSGPMRCYTYRPQAAGQYPGIILFSEIFQQTGPIQRAAAYYAGHGYIVTVPEIFHELEDPGCVIPYDSQGADRGNKNKISKTIQSYDDDARVLIKYLSALPYCNGKLATIGICIGGHLSFRAAMNPEIKAAICFYATDIHKRSLGKGMNDNSLDRIPEIKAELLMIWGRQDPHIAPEGRALIYQKLSEAGTVFTWHEFNGQHAFMRDEGPRYDPELATLCYSLALNLVRRKLSDGDLTTSSDNNVRESKH